MRRESAQRHDPIQPNMGKLMICEKKKKKEKEKEREKVTEGLNFNQLWQLRF
ncbi:MAG: hypothetical protein ACI8XZ_005549 [Gammaproteobacteria bacterium]